jgi:hypothetical protein
MFGPGEYVPDPTEGITDVKNLPPSQTVRTAGTSRKRPAHDVAIWPIATNPGSAPYTTWAICPLDVRLIFW